MNWDCSEKSIATRMEMEEGSECFLGLGQKAELFAGDSEFILGKQYRKPEQYSSETRTLVNSKQYSSETVQKLVLVLCSTSGAGMVGAQSSAD